MAVAGTKGPGRGKYGTGTKGPGWGGPARGMKTVPFTADHQPTSDALVAGQAAAKTAKDVSVASAVEMANLLLSLAKDKSTPAPTRVAAAQALLDRAEGRPGQSIDMSARVTHDDAPSVDRPERETRDQWIERRRRETAMLGAPAGSAN